MARTNSRTKSLHVGKRILDGVPQIACCLLPAARAKITCDQNRFLELAKGFEPPTL